MGAARVAIIGLGRMASTIDDEVVGYPAVGVPYSIAAACAASERLTVVAGCDLLAEKRAAFTARWGVQAVYEDWRAMLAQEAPDIVAICTRGENHAELAVGVAETGPRAIFCEKAIACSLVEADAVLDAVGPRHIPFSTGVLRRYDPRYQVIRDLIAAGGIGQPTAAVHYAATSLLHGHSHSLDTLLYLLGDPRIARLRGELRPRSMVIEHDRIDRDPAAIYQMETDTGVSCVSVPAGNWEFEVVGSEGVVRTCNNGADRSLRRKVPVGTRFSSFEPADVPAPTDQRSATLVLLEELAAAALTGTPVREGVAIAHHVTEGCLSVAESHRQDGAWLDLPLERRDLYVYHV